MKRLILAVIASTILLGCSNLVSDSKHNMEQENLTLATIWYQNSPEVKALYYQGFNIAKERVLEFKQTESVKPKAVVVDIDETMVDNSSFQGKMIKTGKPFTPEMWSEWVSLEKAEALPGAVEFSQFCKAEGVEVIYLSNRTLDELDATMRNMQKLGFAFINPENFYLKDETSKKENRREQVAEKFEIILLLGDNLNDFAEVFENRTNNWGVSVVDEQREQFGRRFIAFPNPMYGDWEKNIYNYERVENEKTRFTLRRGTVKSF
ncbi:MAG: 5'-nucleotidase, lipoprotein e(P4) family [Tenuifilaceae bacterium]|nr:5'-nucleotidase, lipoprotein e(P4) family [Tenuifilaceae bacterium]